MTLNVALIGAGAMGGDIGTRLLETDNVLHVFDLDREKVGELQKLEANAAVSAADEARQSDFVIFS